MSAFTPYKKLETNDVGFDVRPTLSCFNKFPIHLTSVLFGLPNYQKSLLDPGGCQKKKEDPEEKKEKFFIKNLLKSDDTTEKQRKERNRRRFEEEASKMETIVSNLGKSDNGHRCIYCGKVYSRKYGLKIHIR